MADIVKLSDVPVGASIEWGGATHTVSDIRRHAMTSEDGTAWLILDGWQGDPPRPSLNTAITMKASFS